MVAFMICCEGPCRPGLEVRAEAVKVAERNGTAVRRESRTGATSGSAPRVGERSPERVSLAKRPRIPNRDSRGGECEYLDTPLSVAPR